MAVANVAQGEVWYIGFGPVAGHEQDGARPGLVVSNKAMHASGMVIVVPGTRTYLPLPGRVRLPKGHGGVDCDTYLLCTQVRSIDPVRLIRKLGKADQKYVKQVLTQVQYLMALETPSEES